MHELIQLHQSAPSFSGLTRYSAEGGGATVVADHGANRCRRRQMQLSVAGHLELRGGLVSGAEASLPIVPRNAPPAATGSPIRESCRAAARMRVRLQARAHSPPRVHTSPTAPCPPSARSLSLARRSAQATLQRSNSSMTPARLSNSRPPLTARAWRASRVIGRGSTTWCGVQRETSISP